jgi:DNA-binding CsgD family transcriptional regulator
MLLGRDSECSQIDRMLDDARRGISSALVVRGQAGIGKTALCRYAVSRAEGMRVVTARGVEFESGLPFAGLSELFRSVLKQMDAIPRPQAAALADALALDPPKPLRTSELAGERRYTERFTVYAATLSLLAAVAEDVPLLAVIDDAHWLDEPSAEALLFAARRLHTEGVILLFAVRDGESASAFDATGLPELVLSGLDRESSQTLLSQCTGHRIAKAVAEQLIESTGGNPLALKEISSVLSQAQLAGSELLDDPLPAGPSLERVFRRHVSRLPAGAQRALLVAAASEFTSMALFAQAIKTLGGDTADLEVAETAGLISIQGPGLEFRHPLLRSAVYYGASGTDRRAAHRALAQALSGEQEADRRAWHLAAATITPDEEVAQALEGAGSNARRRGGPAAAGKALERAARLTPQTEPRVRRLVAAANDWQLAGHLETAASLLEEALGSTRDPLLRADIQQLRGRVQTSLAPVMRTHELLVAEAMRIEGMDPTRAAMILAEACLPAAMAGEVNKTLCTARRAYALAEAATGLASTAAGLALGAALILTGDAANGHPLVLRCLAHLDVDDASAVQQALGVAGHCLTWVEDYDRQEDLLDRVIDSARTNGALASLPYRLAIRSELRYRTGRWTAAYSDATESLRLAGEMGQSNEYTYALCCVAYIEAAQGRADDCRYHVKRAAEYVEPLELGSILLYSGCVLGLLELGLGQSEAAIAALEPVASFVERVGLAEPAAVQWAPDLVEAYVRVGRLGEAERVLARFQHQAEQTERTWALAATARCRALLSGRSGDANVHFTEALSWHERTSTPFERARTELSWGERLRRDRQRAQACTQLRSALLTFERLGATPWAKRAQAELRAAGGRPRPRRDWSTTEELTPQELQVALTIAQGLTNPEAAATLFLSRKTIEFHLGNVYRKLGLRSRTELTRHFTTTGALDAGR